MVLGKWVHMGLVIKLDMGIRLIMGLGTELDMEMGHRTGAGHGSAAGENIFESIIRALICKR